MEGSEGGHTGSYLLATRIKPYAYLVDVEDFGSCLGELSASGLAAITAAGPVI